MLRVLTAGAVDGPFLEEIGELHALEELTLEWPVTAPNLLPLLNLRKLRRLRIDSPRAVTDFTPLVRLPELTSLEIENAKHLHDLAWLRPFKDRLEVLGIDGSINTAQKIASLEPLDGFAFRRLTLTNVRLADKDLGPLINCRNLRELVCARFIATQADFMRLADARPDMACTWFDPDNWGPRQLRPPP